MILTWSQIDDFTAGYADALARATAFDAAVIGNASAVSSQYADLVSLAARQSLSTLDITVSLDSDRNPNASDMRIFMKDIGSGGKTAYVHLVLCFMPTAHLGHAGVSILWRGYLLHYPPCFTSTRHGSDHCWHPSWTPKTLSHLGMLMLRKISVSVVGHLSHDDR